MFANLQLEPSLQHIMYQICFFQKQFLCFCKQPIAIDSFCLSTKQLRTLDGKHTIALPKKSKICFFPNIRSSFSLVQRGKQSQTQGYAVPCSAQMSWVGECTCLIYSHQPQDNGSKNVSKALFDLLCFISFFHASPFPYRAL